MDSPLGAPTPDPALAQSEVENLLTQIADEENSIVVHTLDNRKQRRPKDSIQPFDFRHPAFLSASELRRIRLRHEEFVRALAARLSLYLRMEFTVQMSQLQTNLYRKFVETLPNPSHISLFKADPLPGVCLLEVNPRLALTIIDRLLGGAAHSVNAEHDLSEIELALMEQVVHVILSEWCGHWHGVKDLRPTLLGHETNGRFLQTSTHDAVMLILCMEARLGDCTERMQLAFPYSTLEPLIRRLAEKSEESMGPPPSSPPSRSRWIPEFDEIKVPVTAAWPDLELAARDVAALKVGDLLEISPSFIDQVNLRLADVSRFRGRLGTNGSKWAVQISETLKK